jgi:predicted Rossmann fold nucleotide-binding protein DprA/Smf involved in DNA uptake
LIISGGASGIDSIAEEYADKHRISKLILYPKYAVYGKAAPLKRNEIMVDIADEVLIIWDGKSRGTKYTADYAAKKNKKVRLIIAE